MLLLISVLLARRGLRRRHLLVTHHRLVLVGCAYLHAILLVATRLPHVILITSLVLELVAVQLALRFIEALGIFLCFPLTHLVLLFELVHFLWEHVGLGEEVVFAWLGVFLFHLHEVLSKLVFVSDDLDARPLRDALVRLDPIENFLVDVQIKPTYIKFFGLWNIIVGIRKSIHLLVRIDVQVWI